LEPTSGNTVTKFVVGISDTLITNIYAQAGKQRIPNIVFACDTEPVVETESPSEWVTLYPRRIDLDNAERLKTFEHTTVVSTVAELQTALDARLAAIDNSPAQPIIVGVSRDLMHRQAYGWLLVVRITIFSFYPLLVSLASRLPSCSPR
jgi:hypothetical protein